MLAALLNTPRTSENWNEWSFHHKDSHLRILQAIKQQLNFNVIEYDIDPIPPDDLPGWLEKNQEYHDEMNAALNLQGSDLESVDFKNPKEFEVWIFQHYQEHFDAESKLGI
jgi:hypothetical protein